MNEALSSVMTMHTNKILHYKRLLERAQASAAAQLHALQAEVRVLRSSSPPTQKLALTLGDDDSRCVCGGKRRKSYWSGYRDDNDDDEYGGPNSLVKAIKGDGKGSFSESEVRKALRGLETEERMRLWVLFLPHYSTTC